MTLGDHQKRPRFAGPLYAQVSDAIRERIMGQEWPPGRPFPNETELARDFAVSVGTMRKALGLLEDERLIVRKQGRGTFIADPASDDGLLALPMLRIDGVPMDAEISSTGVATGRATAEEAGHLQIEEDDSVIRLSRCHRNHGRIAAVETLHVPGARFAGLENETDPATPTLFSLYHSKYGILIASAEESVFVGDRADRPAHHDTAAMTPAQHLCISRVAFDLQEMPVEWSLLHVLANDARLVAARGRHRKKTQEKTALSGRARL